MQDLFQGIPAIWVANLNMDIWRYGVFAVAAWLTLWVVLGHALRHRKVRVETPPPRQLVSEFIFSIRSIAVFSTIGVGMAVLDRLGLYPLSTMAGAWGPAWFVISLVLMVVGQDAYIYWTHRAMHRLRLFRSFHVRHHRSSNPSPFTAYSFDLGEAVVMAGFVALWPLIVPTPWGVIPMFMMHQIFRNTLLHAGYELMPARADGRPMFDWFTTTVHHDLHHGMARWNFAPWFTWWDRWRGTEHPEYLARFAATVRRPGASERLTPAGYDAAG